MKLPIIVACAIAVVSSFAEDTELITGFVASQDPVSRIVRADFTLTEKAIFIVDVRTNIAPGSAETASIGAENFKSLRNALDELDVVPGNRVMPAGDYKLVWKPSKDWPNWKLENTVSIQVKAYRLASPPNYMVVDAKSGLSLENRLTFYETAEDLPQGGLTNMIYKESKLVMRRIPAAGIKWRMGDPESTTTYAPRYITLTEDYYMAVFEFTKGQCRSFGLYTTTAAGDMTADQMHFTTVRGGTWPAGGHDAIANGTDLDKIRNRTGLKFDLPTSAQWEFACRAGTGTTYYWGDSVSDIAEYETIGSAGKVGLHKPNGFGLYDMSGNLSEVTLDLWSDTPPESPLIDPPGPATGDDQDRRVMRGGRATTTTTTTAASYYREKVHPYNANNKEGCRLCCPVALPIE